jgi:hypothetical protein
MPEILTSSSLEIALANDFANVLQVRHVPIERADGPIFILIAVDHPEPGVRRQIYQKGLDLIAAFPEIEFDFNLIPAMNRAPDEIATGARRLFASGIGRAIETRTRHESERQRRFRVVAHSR